MALNIKTPENFLHKYSNKDKLNRVNELLSVGKKITHLTTPDVDTSLYRKDQSYCADLKVLYSIWRENVKSFLLANKQDFYRECEIFLEPDTIPILPPILEEQNPDFDGGKLLKDINRETRIKLEILRSVRSFVQKKYPLDISAKPVISIKIERRDTESNKYRMVVNEDYSKIFYKFYRRDNGSGVLLYDIAKSKERQVAVDGYRKNDLKYWNINKNNPVYKKFLPTEIIKKKNDFYCAAVNMEIVSSKTFNGKIKSVG